jgi:hypothetical protein
MKEMTSAMFCEYVSGNKKHIHCENSDDSIYRKWSMETSVDGRKALASVIRDMEWTEK